MKRLAWLLMAVVLMSGAALEANAAERLRVMLDWFVNPDHGPLIVAQQRGMFAAAGLDVELVAPADPNDQTVERRRYQGAESHQGQALTHLQMELRLVGHGDVGLAGPAF